VQLQATADLDNFSLLFAFAQDLMNIAMTTLSSKILTGDKVHFARLAVDAILRLKGVHPCPLSSFNIKRLPLSLHVFLE